MQNFHRGVVYGRLPEGATLIPVTLASNDLLQKEAGLVIDLENTSPVYKGDSEHHNSHPVLAGDRVAGEPTLGREEPLSRGSGEAAEEAKVAILTAAPVCVKEKTAQKPAESEILRPQEGKKPAGDACQFVSGERATPAPAHAARAKTTGKHPGIVPTTHVHLHLHTGAPEAKFQKTLPTLAQYKDAKAKALDSLAVFRRKMDQHLSIFDDAHSDMDLFFSAHLDIALAEVEELLCREPVTVRDTAARPVTREIDAVYGDITLLCAVDGCMHPKMEGRHQNCPCHATRLKDRRPCKTTGGANANERLMRSHGSDTDTDDMSEAKRPVRHKKTAEQKKGTRKKRNEQLTQQLAILKGIDGIKEKLGGRAPIKGKGRYKQPKRGMSKLGGKGSYWSDLGGKAGNFLGSKAGGWLEKLFNSVTGQGAYASVDMPYQVQSNSLLNGAPAPIMHSDGTTTPIFHREFLFNLPMTEAFSITVLVIDVVDPVTCPWLSAIAPSYQQNRWEGAMVDLKTLSLMAVSSSTGAAGAGSVTTAFMPDVYAPEPTSKAELANLQFSVSGMPQESQLAPIECASSLTGITTLKTRSPGIIPPDLQFYQQGKVYIVTEGAPNDYPGAMEIWLTYHVSLIKPQLALSARLGLGCCLNIAGAVDHNGFEPDSPEWRFNTLGAQLVAPNNNDVILPYNIQSNTTFLLVWQIAGDTTAAVKCPQLSFDNGLSLISAFNNHSGQFSATNYKFPTSSATSTYMFYVGALHYDGSGTLNEPPIISVTSGSEVYPDNNLGTLVLNVIDTNFGPPLLMSGTRRMLHPIAANMIAPLLPHSHTTRALNPCRECGVKCGTEFCKECLSSRRLASTMLRPHYHPITNHEPERSARPHPAPEHKRDVQDQLDEVPWDSLSHAVHFLPKTRSEVESDAREIEEHVQRLAILRQRQRKITPPPAPREVRNATRLVVSLESDDSGQDHCTTLHRDHGEATGTDDIEYAYCPVKKLCGEPGQHYHRRGKGKQATLSPAEQRIAKKKPQYSICIAPIPVCPKADDHYHPDDEDLIFIMRCTKCNGATKDPRLLCSRCRGTQDAPASVAPLVDPDLHATPTITSDGKVTYTTEKSVWYEGPRKSEKGRCGECTGMLHKGVSEYEGIECDERDVGYCVMCVMLFCRHADIEDLAECSNPECSRILMYEDGDTGYGYCSDQCHDDCCDCSRWAGKKLPSGPVKTETLAAPLAAPVDQTPILIDPPCVVPDAPPYEEPPLPFLAAVGAAPPGRPILIYHINDLIGERDGHAVLRQPLRHVPGCERKLRDAALDWCFVVDSVAPLGNNQTCLVDALNPDVLFRAQAELLFDEQLDAKEWPLLRDDAWLQQDHGILFAHLHACHLPPCYPASAVSHTVVFGRVKLNGAVKPVMHCRAWTHNSDPITGVCIDGCLGCGANLSAWCRYQRALNRPHGNTGDDEPRGPLEACCASLEDEINAVTDVFEYKGLPHFSDKKGDRVAAATLFLNAQEKESSKRRRKFVDAILPIIPFVKKDAYQVTSEEAEFFEGLTFVNARTKALFFGFTRDQRKDATGFFKYKGRAFFVIGPNNFNTARSIIIFRELYDWAQSSDSQLMKMAACGEDGKFLPRFAAAVKSRFNEYHDIDRLRLLDSRIVDDTTEFFIQRMLFRDIRMRISLPDARSTPTFQRMGTRRTAVLPGNPIEWARLYVESMTTSRTTAISL